MSPNFETFERAGRYMPPADARSKESKEGARREEELEALRDHVDYGAMLEGWKRRIKDAEKGALGGDYDLPDKEYGVQHLGGDSSSIFVITKNSPLLRALAIELESSGYEKSDSGGANVVFRKILSGNNTFLR